MLLAYLIILLMNIQLAYTDSLLIKDGKKINHPVNAIVYSLILFMFFAVHTNLWMIGAMLMMRGIVFDISLNLFNKKKWNDISSETSSIIDKIEREIFGFDGTTQYISESILLILLIGIGMM